MKVQGQIIDPNPNEPARDLDTVTICKTDLSREMIKGALAVVVDVHTDNPGFYSVEVNNNAVKTLHRSEFRLATPEDIARSHEALAKKKIRAEKNGKEMEFRFRIPEFPGDRKI